MQVTNLNDLIAADVLSRAAGSGEITLTTGTSEDGRTFYQATRDGGVWGAYSPEALAAAIVNSLLPSKITFEDDEAGWEQIAELSAREMQRKGGQAKSAAKTAAARENGKKGGRPRKEKPNDLSGEWL